MSIEEKRRASFENHINSEDLEGESWLDMRGDGSYKDPVIQEMWVFWNAAIDSMVIELDGGLHLRSEVYAVLESAGLKVKP